MAETNYILKFASETPLDIDNYIGLGGFKGLVKCFELKPYEIVDEIIDSKLRGRGGAGFETGLKWASLKGDSSEKYLLVNADEGEPGTFKDRYIINHCPFLLLEGVLIAAYAIGAPKAYIYIRGEYLKEFNQLNLALEILKNNNYLGNKILNTDFYLDIELKQGAGSYVVGDETALINSLMGNRGNPLLKPPYPTQSGLWGKPTLVNNVETLACVPLIVQNGATWFRSIGIEECPGPKLFSVSGNVNKPGIYEFPMGTKLKEIIKDVGGIEGVLKAVQIGGTAGPVYGPEALGYKLDYSSMRSNGGPLGSGALVFMNSKVSMVEILEVTIRFFADESCGKCLPCRLGTRQLAHIISKIISGQGELKHIDQMRNIVSSMRCASFCPFGKSVAVPVLAIIDNFGDEIVKFINEQLYVREMLK